MAAILHLLKAPPTDVAAETIRRQVDAGDRVTAALLEGAEAGRLPDSVRVHRIPGELSYEGLLEKIFEADRVIAW